MDKLESESKAKQSAIIGGGKPLKLPAKDVEEDEDEFDKEFEQIVKK